MPLYAGQSLGPYRIESLIGEGGMGEVYRATDERLHRRVAIKILTPRLAKDLHALKRFESEARALASFTHPNILSIYDVGNHDDTSYVVTELLEGKSLRARISHPSLPWKISLQYAIEISGALSAAHSKGVIHRDLKPENIFITSDDRVKVLDFGLAQLKMETQNILNSEAPTFSERSDSGSLTGTIPYMSPEQFRGEKADQRSDIFSFGCVLYEMLSGEHPFSGKTAAEKIGAILKDEPKELSQKNPEIPLQLDRIAARCLEKNPEKRFQSANDLTFALREILVHGTTTSRTQSPRERKSRHVPFGLLAAIIGLTVLTVVSVRLVPKFGKLHGTIQSVAVLPFVNDSRDPDSDYLSEGITESLINNLSQISDLRVIARTSVFRYKGKALDPVQAGRELKVDAIVTGTVTQRAGDLIVQADLIDVGKASELWGDQYSKRSGELLSIQNQISKEIMEKLRIKLTGEQERHLSSNYSSNAEAYQLYMKGRYFWNKRTPDGFNKALDFFHQAIQKDNAFALAYSGIADVYLAQASFALLPSKDVSLKAKEAAEKAISLNSDLAEPHASLASVLYQYDWNWKEAEQEYQKAIRVNPNYAIAHQWYSIYLVRQKRFDEAHAEAARALQLDPLSLPINFIAAANYFFARDYNKSIAGLNKTLEMDPNFLPAMTFLAHCYLQQRRYNEALAEIKKGLAVGPSLDLLSYLPQIYAQIGKTAEAKQEIEKLQTLSGKRFVPLFVFAIDYNAIGDEEKTFEFLKGSASERDYAITSLSVYPGFDNVRNNGRFQSLLRQIGLPQ